MSLRHPRLRPIGPRPRVLRAAAYAAIGAALIAGPAAAARAATPPTASSALSATTYAPASCYHLVAGRAGCQAFVRTNVAHHLGDSPSASVSGLAPADLTSAYGVASTGGSSATIAIVDAYNDPAIASDMSVYRGQFGLPACTTGNGCFTVVNQSLGSGPLPAAPLSGDDWSPETSLDVEMVSALCPNCHITLVEANSDSDSDLFAAAHNAAARFTFVSNSWGSPEASTDPANDSGFNHPGHVIDFASGDTGNTVIYPSSSPYVTAVGGTSLYKDASTGRGWNETAWGSTGSGCSQYEAQPAWQTSLSSLAAVCARRATSDVSAIADPNTGVAEYDSYGSNGGWNVYGGTSVATPIVTAIWALAGAPGAQTAATGTLYAHPSRFFDVTSGNDGSCGNLLCQAGPGWDGPTGLGSPDGPGSFAAGAVAAPGDSVAVQAPNVQFGVVGTPLRPLGLTATDSRGLAARFSATGLPPGLTVSPAGTVAGVPTKAGVYGSVITATDPDGGHGSSKLAFVVFSF